MAEEAVASAAAISEQPAGPQARIPEPPPGTEAKVNISYTAKAPQSAPLRHPLAFGPRGTGVVIPQKYEESVKRLNELAGNTSHISDYRVHVHRRGPKFFKTANGSVSITTGELTEVEIDEFSNLKDLIEETYGGGEYRLIVSDGAGFNQLHVDFKISVENCPPRVNGEPVGSAPTAGHSGNGSNGQSQEAIKEEERMRLEKEKKHHALEIKKAEGALEEYEFRQEENRRLRLKAQHEDNGKPQSDALKAQLDLIQKQIDNSNARFEKLIETMQSRPDPMEKVLATLGAILPAIFSSRSGQEDNASKAIIEAAKLNAEAQKEVNRTTADANKEIMKTFMEVQKEKRDPKDDDFKRMLLQTLLDNKLNAPQDNMKSYIEAMSMGRDQAMQMLEWSEGARGGGAEFDPESPGASLVNMLMEMFRKRPGMPPAPGLQPAGAYNEQQLRQIAQQVVTPIIRSELQKMAGVSQPALITAAPSPDNKFDIEPSVSMQPAQAMQPPLSLSSPSVPLAPTPAIASQIEDATGESPEERLRFHLGETLRIMLADITDGRAAHEWVQYALEKLNDHFLKALAACSDHAARLNLVQQYADPALYAQLQALVVSRPGGYQALVANMDVLTEGIRGSIKG